MPEHKPIKISPSDQEILQQQANLLHLFHHRNKNQHRHSIWWRHFSTFRKQVNHLLSTVNQLNATPSTHLQRSRQKAEQKKLQTNLSQRLDIWQNVLVAKWQHAFSQLVADARFAQLGIVLLALLARICRIVGVTARLEEVAQREVERVLDHFGREVWGDRDGDSGHVMVEGDGEDVGEVVEREEAVSVEEANEGPATTQAVMSDTQSSRTKRKASLQPTHKTAKRKRGKVDAIDDLFSSLS